MSETQATSLGWREVARTSVGQAVVSSTAMLAVLAAAKFLLQLAGIRHYGFFRDELYYLACGEHLAWGYVDQPPLIALVAWFERYALGGSLVAVRILPVLAGAAIVFLTGIFARELGGGRFAQFLAAAAMLFAPAYLAFDSFLSMNAFEPLLWLVCAWIAVRVVKGASPKWWLAFGLVAGIGLENKHTMLVFGFAIVGGLLLSKRWDIFQSPYIWLGGAIALAIFLPNFVWEARHGWPQIEVVRNGQLYKNLPVSPPRFFADQIAFLNPLAFPIWLAGLIWCFWGAKNRRWRFLGWAYLVVLAIFLFMNGKSYYMLPIYPVLMAAGGVAVEDWTEEARWTWARVALPTLLVISGLIALPFGVPLLPIDSFLRYSQFLPYSQMGKTERDAVDVELPQLYADMFGWDNIATTVAQVYQALPASERAGCAILAGNYGEAGAIDYYGPALGLPNALSGHNSYFYWGPRQYSGECVILYGERSSTYIKLFNNVHLAATIVSPHAMPNEQSIPVYVCRDPSAPLSVLWPRFKMII
jgi:Dolichyl-phosphate-mannose-protein mannosyltransferase